MSAAELRKAAETLRERAEAATSGPWDHSHQGLQGGEVVHHSVIRVARVYVNESGYKGCENADYIATVHPGVGLALADWLDSVARVDLGRGQQERHEFCDPDCDVVRALTLARLVNGGAS